MNPQELILELRRIERRGVDRKPVLDDFRPVVERGLVDLRRLPAVHGELDIERLVVERDDAGLERLLEALVRDDVPLRDRAHGGKGRCRKQCGKGKRQDIFSRLR
jgi:hypothetical protein